jgi:hypothetical protein
MSELVAHLAGLLAFQRSNDAAGYVLVLDARVKCLFGTASWRAAPLARRNTRPDRRHKYLPDGPLVVTSQLVERIENRERERTSDNQYDEDDPQSEQHS